MAVMGVTHAQIYRPLDNLDNHYAADSRGKSAQQIQALSLQQYQEFVAMDVNSYKSNVHYNRDDSKAQYLTLAKAKIALEAANDNPVVSLYQYEKYDPDNRGIGFCFGRAMFVDLYLAINKFNRGSIKKAFVVGPMSSGDGIIWGWHVTTIAQAKDKSGKEIWLAIDPIVGKILEVTAWYKDMLKMSTDKKLRMYITEAGKFSQSSYRYDYNNFNHPYYNNYFTDMLKWFESNNVSNDLKL
jgi:hypothetical protein